MSGRASHAETPGGIKALVAGLTLLIGGEVGGGRAGTGEEEDERPPVAPEDVRRAVEGDFLERNYLWTGDISLDVYAKDCVFEDPTIRFAGVDAFQRNLAKLEPWVDRFVRSPRSELRAPVVINANGDVEANWRMSGDLALPWRPAIDVAGTTVYRLRPSDGRIHKYDERWEVDALSALRQLVVPRPRGRAAD